MIYLYILKTMKPDWIDRMMDGRTVAEVLIVSIFTLLVPDTLGTAEAKLLVNRKNSLDKK